MSFPKYFAVSPAHRDHIIVNARLLRESHDLIVNRKKNGFSIEDIVPAIEEFKSSHNKLLDVECEVEFYNGNIHVYDENGGSY